MTEWVIERLISLMGPLAMFSKERRELKDSALRAVSTALQETEIYYRDLERGKERDQDRENQLVRYWGAAAIPLRHIDEELAFVCDRKSAYWLNPEHMSQKEVKELGIKLSDMSCCYKKLLRPDRFSRAGLERRNKQS